MAPSTDPIAEVPHQLIGLDEFITAFAQQVYPEDISRLSPDTHLIDDLGFDSLQMLVAMEWIEELIPSISVLPDSDILSALSTLRHAHNFYLAESCAPVSDADLKRDKSSGLVVSLRPVRPDDLPYVYELVVRDEHAWRWRFQGALPSYDEFVRSFSTSVFTQLVVTSRRDSHPIGIVVAHNASLINRTTYLSALVSPQNAVPGPGAEAVRLFADYLFRTWEFEKVCMEVPEFNIGQFQSGLGDILDVEGCLKKHLYCDGRRWDQYIVTIHRSRFRDRWPLSSRIHTHLGRSSSTQEGD